MSNNSPFGKLFIRSQNQPCDQKIETIKKRIKKRMRELEMFKSQFVGSEISNGVFESLYGSLEKNLRILESGVPEKRSSRKRSSRKHVYVWRKVNS